MKLWLLIAALTVALTGCSREPDLSSIAPDDPVRPILEQWGQRTLQRYAASNQSKPSFRPWAELHSTALNTLFPNHRFLVISWGEQPERTWSSDQRAAHALGLSIVLAYRRDTGAWTEIPASGNYEPYGHLLADQNVELKSDDHAELIWNGFCDLHQKHWRGRSYERKTDRVWELGVNTIDGVRYHYEIDLDESGKVLFATFRAKISSK